MNDIMSKVDLAEKAIEAANLAHKKALEEAIEPALKYIAKEYGKELGLITLIGYTPWFNDGEPCTHTSDVLYGYSGLEDYGLEDRMGDWFEDEEEKIEELMEREVNLSSEVRKFGSGILLPYYEQKLHTDFLVHIFFDEDGTYRVEEDEYNCGY